MKKNQTELKNTKLKWKYTRRNKKLDDIGEQISNLAKSSNHQAEERTKKEYSLYL